jgi:hypothetical protein
MDGEGGGGGEPVSVVGSDGNFTDDFYGSHGEENREYLSRYKTPSDLSKATVEMRKKFGKDPNSMAEIPSDTSSDEVKAAWRKANGVPETLDEYKYDYSDDFATKLGPLDDTRMANIREFAHTELGLSQDKFQKLLDFYHTSISADNDAFSSELEAGNTARFEAGMDILKGQWLEGTEERTAAALAHLQKYGEFEVKGKDGAVVNPLEKLIEENPNIKTSPWMTMILDNMASKMGEAGRIGGRETGALSLDGINSQIADIRAKQSEIRRTNPGQRRLLI